EPISSGYRVHWYDYRTGAWNFDDGKTVVLAAGAINSPELLLRSRDMYGMLPNVSSHAGQHVSANGDMALGGLYPNLPDNFKAEIYKGQVISLVSYHYWRTKKFIIE